MKKLDKGLFAFISMVIVFAISLGLAMLALKDRLENQQRQIDETSLTTMAWFRSQGPYDEGNCVIKAGTDYDLVFADFSRETAAITSKGNNGETHRTIVHGVPPKLLEEWSKSRHFRG